MAIIILIIILIRYTDFYPMIKIFLFPAPKRECKNTRILILYNAAEIRNKEPTGWGLNKCVIYPGWGTFRQDNNQGWHRTQSQTIRVIIAFPFFCILQWYDVLHRRPRRDCSTYGKFPSSGLPPRGSFLHSYRRAYWNQRRWFPVALWLTIVSFFTLLTQRVDLEFLCPLPLSDRYARDRAAHAIVLCPARLPAVYQVSHSSGDGDVRCNCRTERTG